MRHALLSAALLLALAGQALAANGAVPTVNVLDGQNAAYQGVVPMTYGTTYAAQRSVGVLCTASGSLTFTFPDGSALMMPVYVGWQIFPFAVVSVTVPSDGSGANAVVYSMK